MHHTTGDRCRRKSKGWGHGGWCIVVIPSNRWELCSIVITPISLTLMLQYAQAAIPSGSWPWPAPCWRAGEDNISSSPLYFLAQDGSLLSVGTHIEDGHRLTTAERPSACHSVYVHKGHCTCSPGGTKTLRRASTSTEAANWPHVRTRDGYCPVEAWRWSHSWPSLDRQWPVLSHSKTAMYTWAFEGRQCHPFSLFPVAY